MDIGASTCKRLSTLKSLRSPYAATWEDCFKYSYPLRARGFFGDMPTADDGRARRADLLDSTTTEAVRIMVSHIIDGMVPANALWFGLDVGEESDEEKRWLYDGSKFIWQNIHNSNFDSEIFEAFIDAVCAGWFVLYIDEAEQGGFAFQQWPIQQCYIACSKQGMPVDIIYREFELTAEQAVTQYGQDKVSPDIRKCMEDGKPDEKFTFCHAIYPRSTYVAGARLAKNLPFASVHTETKTKTVVRESGYHEFPCVCPRWMKIPGSDYAVGAVFDALPDSKSVNEIKRLMHANLDIAVGGLWIAEDDGVLNPRNIKIGPRRVIVANSVDSMKELRSSADFNTGFVSEERIQAQIKRIMMADLLPPLEGQPRTAAEIYARLAHIRKMLGPVFGRLQSEFLKPTIERCFGIAFRAGVLGVPPESLANRSYTIKYMSPLARSQKLEEVAAIDQYVAGAVMIAEIQPEILDNIDFDAAMRYKAEALGVPTQIVPDEDTVKARREQRKADQQQQLDQMQAREVMGEAGKMAAKKAIGV